MTTKNITFGGKPPIVGAELVEASILAGHRYYNQLIEHARKRLEQAEELRLRLIPGLDDAEALVDGLEVELEQLRTDISRRNADERRKTASDEDRQATKDLQAKLKEARTARKLLRQTAKDNAEYQAALSEVWATAFAADKAAYNESTCWWGTKLKIAESVERAVDGAVKHGGLPRFRRWDQVRFDLAAGDGGAFVGAGDGIAATQIQCGMTVEELLSGTDSRVRLEFVDDGTRTSPRAARKARVHIRLGSDGREPLWAVVPIYCHRGGELPTDARIMWVTVVRRAGATRRFRDGWRPWYEWSVQFTVRTETARPTATSGMCGINLGWRVMTDGTLRVAVAVGDDGETHELRLPGHILSGWKLCERLQATRDLHFDRARAALYAWLRGDDAPAALTSLAAEHHEMERPEEAAPWLAWAVNFERPKEWPAWVLEATKHIGMWKSRGRLAQVIERWAQQRFRGDAHAFTALQAWRVREAHLHQWEQSQRTKLDRTRKDLYRKWAAMLARRYRGVAVEDTDYRQMIRTPEAERNADDAAMREHQRHAAAGLLRQCLMSRAAAPLSIEAKNISRIHESCGAVLEWDRRRDLRHVCERCGGEFDQDESAAANVLARAKIDGCGGDSGSRVTEPSPSNGDVPVVSAGAGRWKRRKDARSQKATGVTT